MVHKEKQRIEQLFATLKTAGLNLEATQLESIAAIQRLTVLALSVAVRILQLFVRVLNDRHSAPFLDCLQSHRAIIKIASE